LTERLVDWLARINDEENNMAHINIFINKNINMNRGYRKLKVWNESIYLFTYVKKKIKQLNSISFKTKLQIENSGELWMDYQVLDLLNHI